MTQPTPGESIKPASELVRELLELKQINQANLAAEVGVTQPTISRWLSGKQEPNYSQTVALMELSRSFLVKTIGEVRLHTAYVSGEIISNLKIVGFKDEKHRMVRVPNYYKSDGLGALVITDHAHSLPGFSGWIVLFGALNERWNWAGGFFIFSDSQLGPILRQWMPGSRADTMHLLAPNLPPILDTKAKPTYQVLGIIPPSNEILEVSLPLSPHAISHVFDG